MGQKTDDSELPREKSEAVVVECKVLDCKGVSG